MAKKVKYRWTTVSLDFLKRGVMIFVGPKEELIRVLKEKYTEYGELIENTLTVNPDLVSNSNGLTFKCSQDAIIWFPEKVSLGSLVHELTHATIHILDRVDIKLTEDTEEIFCYILQYLTEQLFDWMVNKK